MTCKSTFITSLFIIIPFYIQGKPGLELTVTYDYEKTINVLVAGTYKTDYVKTKIDLNPAKSFPENISLKFSPAHKANNSGTDSALALTAAFSLTVASGTLLYIAKKEIERAIDNKYIDLYLERCDKLIQETDPRFEKIERQLFHG